MKSLIDSTRLYKIIAFLFLSIMSHGHAIKHCPEYYQLLYNKLSEKTNIHINYLCSIGLAERAQGIRIQPFTLELDNSGDHDEDINLKTQVVSYKRLKL